MMIFSLSTDTIRNSLTCRLCKLTYMLNINQFIREHITGRQQSMFAADIRRNSQALTDSIKGKSILVIGGAGTIGSSFIKAVLRFNPGCLYVVDLNENGLTELTRDIRSTHGLYVPEEYKTYTLDFESLIFEKIFREKGGFDIVANFSAHKHVRSEKDRYSVQALIENNIFKAEKLLELMKEFPPQSFFCVSTDKAANPVNVMGCSKKIMEDLIFCYSDYYKITTARFANVAFSNGSLPDGWVARLMKRQPLAAPKDVRRYFVSPEESGEICMLACILGRNREIYFPKLKEDQMMTFSDICDHFLDSLGLTPKVFTNDEDAKRYASENGVDSKEYPVVYFNSDTTGEKDFEEFFIDGEKTDLDRYESLGVITDVECKDKEMISSFIRECKTLFCGDFTKEEIVRLMKKVVPNFEHEEKGKNLDQKM